MARREQYIRQLYQELPDLVGQGVVPADTAQRLREHYGEPGASQGARLLIAAFGVLGAVLVGAGIILLLAHNWEDLSRPVRAALAFAPLVGAQCATAWVIATGPRGAAWREGVGTFLLLAVGSSIALVAQTYHIYGDLERFLLTWSLLALPIAYVLDATLPALLTLAGLASWQALGVQNGGQGFYFWPLAAALAPHFWSVARRERYAIRAAFSLWVIPVCLASATAFALHRAAPQVIIVSFACFFACLYLAGALWFREAQAGWQNPLRNLGAIGFAGLALFLSYGEAWEEVADGYRALATVFGSFGLAAVSGLWLGIWLVLLAVHVRAGRRDVLPIGALPLIVAAGIAIAELTDAVDVSTVLFNLYVLAVGVFTVRSGAAERRLGRVNCGMILIGALILIRFFDSDIGFVARGIAFIAIGTAFLIVNLRMVRRDKRSV